MFTLSDVCDRWMKTESSVVEMVMAGKVHCQVDPFRADSFEFYVTEEKRKEPEILKSDAEYNSGFKEACTKAKTNADWKKNGHPQLRFSQADIDKAEADHPELARAAQSSDRFCSKKNSNYEPDSPAKFVRRLKEKKFSSDEIKYRLYREAPKQWKMTQWIVECIVEGIDYPPKGPKGDVERNNHKAAYLRAEKRFLRNSKSTK